jgi:ribosomal subunit interface protein
MKIQVNSDHTIEVDAGLKHFIEQEVSRLLDRFAMRLTRVEVHLSDVDNKKTGNADKRCLVEARPAGARPRTATAKATNISSAVDEALRKMQRSLTTSFVGRRRPKVSTISTYFGGNEVSAKKAANMEDHLGSKESAVLK